MTLERSSLGHLDAAAVRVINHAADEAKRYQQSWLGTEHLLVAFAQLDHDGIRKLFGSQGLAIASIRRAFEAFDFGTTTREEGIFITHRVQRVLGIAEGLALRDERRATAEDLLLAILEDGGGVAVHLIRSCGGDPARIARTLKREPA